MKNKKLPTLVIFVGLTVIMMAFMPRKAQALPLCIDQNTVISAPSAYFPRTGFAKNASAGCADVPQTTGMTSFTDTNGSHVLLSSYYYDFASPPGSPLHTPNASFTLFSTYQPPVAQNAVVTVWWCRGANPNLVGISKDAVFVGTGSQNVSFTPGEFVQDSTTGTAVWRSGEIRAAIINPVTTDTICKINVIVTTSDSVVSFTPDPSRVDPSTNGIPDRYNQVNWSTSKAGLGPVAGLGAFALRTDYTSATSIEYAFDFRPDCNIVGPTPAYLKWYDSDAPSAANPPATTNGAFTAGSNYPRTLLYDYDSTGALVNTVNLTGQPDYEVLQGNDEFGQSGIVVQPGHRYRWVWWNIGGPNGLQLWMPFSEFTSLSGFTCGRPPVGYADSCQLIGTNTVIYGWAYDNDANAGDSLPQVQVNVGGVLQTVNSSISGYRNGPIEGFLDAFAYGTGPARDGQYGWTAVYSGFTSGNSYGIAGTLLNVGPGSNQGLGINTANSLDGLPVYGFPGNVIPQECLPPPPAPAIVCPAVGGVNPASAEPAQILNNITVNFTNNGNADLVGATLSVTVNGVLYPAVGFAPNPLPFAAGGNTATSIVGAIPATPMPLLPGNVPVSWTISGGNTPGVITCSGSIKVAALPYFRVYGGDVKSCTGTINAWGTTVGVGAASEYGVTAGLGIDGFESASQRGAFPTYPIGLTFANTAGTFGGSFGGGICMPNYWTVLRDAPVAAAGAINLTGSGQVQYTGNSTINQQSTSSRLTVFVDGDLNITGTGVTYGAPWASAAAIPYITIVTCGNIYINNTVTDLTGWYIALPRSACVAAAPGGGTIYTCTNGFAFIDQSTQYNDCLNTLTVRGSFSANKVKFLRTRGSLSLGIALETQASANIAEKFIYGAESWVGQPVQRLAPPTTGGTKFDAITGLPPIL